MTAQTKSQISLARIHSQFHDAGMTPAEIARRTGVKVSELPCFVHIGKKLEAPPAVISADRYKITPTQRQTLDALGKRGALIGEVAVKLGISRGAADCRIAALKERGLVRKNLKHYYSVVDQGAEVVT